MYFFFQIFMTRNREEEQNITREADISKCLVFIFGILRNKMSKRYFTNSFSVDQND